MDFSNPQFSFNVDCSSIELLKKDILGYTWNEATKCKTKKTNYLFI